VIDDEPRLLMIVRLVLEMHHDVTACSSAREALERLVLGEKFDMILCDVMMPVMTGADFHLEVAQAVPDMADRIVFMTGGIMSKAIADYLRHIPNPCVEKPFTEHTLLELIRLHVA
jgi:CheY-like chemotaxis protein